MKKYNSFLFEYKQKAIWEELRPNVELDSIKSFINKYKSPKKDFKDPKFNTLDEVLKYFDNQDKIDKISKVVYENDMAMSDEVLYHVSFDIEIIKAFIEEQNIPEDSLDFNYIDEENLDDIDFFIGSDLSDFLPDFEEFEEWYVESEYIVWNNIVDQTNFENLIETLKYNVEDNKIPIYRALLIEKDVDKHGKEYHGVGVFWSYDSSTAEAHCGDFCSDNHSILLSARVDIKNIDWEQTMYKALYNLSDEEEIEIHYDVTVELTGYVLEDAISNYATIKIRDYDYLRTLKIFKNMSDYDMREYFLEEAREKYDIEFDEPIIVKV